MAMNTDQAFGLDGISSTDDFIGGLPSNENPADEQATKVIGRRGILGVLAASAALTACNDIGLSRKSPADAVDAGTPTDIDPVGSVPDTGTVPVVSTPVVGPVTPASGADALDTAVTRLTFGYTPGMRAAVSELGIEGFVNDQLSKNVADPAVEALASGISGIATEEFDWERGDRKGGKLLQDLGIASLVRATNSDHQLFEVMSRFWSDHFNVQAVSDSFGSVKLARHHQEFVIRPNAMGKFRDILHSAIRSPAMLAYLDNNTSDANSPEGVNENLGREILELHTLGIDENEQLIYSETDVQQAALALAGLTFNSAFRFKNYYNFRFQESFAYDGTVSLLNGAWTSNGLSGLDVADSMITFLANHPQTARHIAYKLCRRFVADAPPTSLVESAAAVFQANDTDIVPTLAHIFGSDEFAQSTNQKYRRPFEYMVAAVRALGSSVPVVAVADQAPTTAFLSTLSHMPWQQATPDGYGDSAADWINSGGTQERWNFAGKLSSGEGPIAVNPSNYLPVAATVGDLINQLTIQIGIGGLPESDQLAIATAGETTLSAESASLNDAQVARITALVLSHPFFHTR